MNVSAVCRSGRASEPDDTKYNTQEREDFDDRDGLREEEDTQNGRACRTDTRPHRVTGAHGNGP